MQIRKAGWAALLAAAGVWLCLSAPVEAATSRAKPGIANRLGARHTTFVGVAFAGTRMPWLTLALGDLGVKLLMNLFLLAPFRALMWNLAKPPDTAKNDGWQ